MTTKPPIRPRKRRTLLNPGANRGARENIKALKDFNRTSTAATIETLYVDPVPGRAEETAELARREGVPAEAIEATGEEVLDDARGALQLANVDAPATLAELVDRSGARGIPTLGYLMLTAGNGRLAGLRLALPAGEHGRREEAVAFLRALAAVTARSGSRALFGDEARNAHHLSEPLIRAAFAEHTETELARLSAGVLPEHAPIDITFDGRASLPVLVVRRTTYGEAGDVLEEVARAPAVPLRRGTTFIVAEVTDGDGIRLHEARRRIVDGRLAVRPSTTIDEAMMRAAIVERPAILAVREEDGRPGYEALAVLFGWAAERGSGTSGAVERVRTDTLTATSPILTSD